MKGKEREEKLGLLQFGVGTVPFSDTYRQDKESVASLEDIIKDRS